MKKKILIVFMVIVTFSQGLYGGSIKASANDNNLGHTNGAEAAIVVAIANIAVTTLHNLMRSTWAAHFSSGEPVWRSNEDNADVRQRLLRHDNRGPDEIFQHGFAPRNEIQSIYNFQWNLGNYLAGRYRDRDNPFVSATRPEVDSNGQILRQWTPNSFYRTEFVYEIFAPGGIDVNASSGDSSPYPEQLEITFPGGIRPEFIRSVRQLSYNYETNQLDLVQIYINPNFIGLPDVIIPDGTKVTTWNNKNTNDNINIDKVVDDTVDPMKRPGKLKRDPFKDDPIYPKRIPDGEYQISSSIDTNKIVDLDASNNQLNELPVTIYQNYNKENQKWIFTYDPNKKAYRIKSSTVINQSRVLVGNNDNGKTYGYQEKYAGDNSYWRLEGTTNGYYILRNYEVPTRVLDLNDSNPTDGNKIIVHPENGTSAQKWNIVPISNRRIADGEYQVSSKLDRNKVIDLSVQDSASEHELPVSIYQNFTSEHQKWSFIYDPNRKAYRIKNSGLNNRVLTGNVTNKNVFGYLEQNAGDDSYWKIEQNQEGFYTIRNYEDNNLVLDLDKQNSDSGTRLIVHSAINYLSSQEWEIEPVVNKCLPDGEYQLSSSLNPNKLIDLDKGASNAIEKMPVIIYKNNSQSNQKWNLAYNADKKAYRIANSEQKNRVLVGDANGSTYGYLAEYAGDNSYWKVMGREDGFYNIMNVENPNLRLTLTDSNTADGTKIEVTGKSDSKAQNWRLQKVDTPIVPEGEYTISTKLNYRKVIDANNTEAVIYDHLNLNTAEWLFVYDKNKKGYKIYSEYYRDKGLLYQNEGFKVSVDVLDTGDPNDLRSFWTIEYDVENGGYLIRSLFSPNQVLDLRSSNTDNFTPILSYDINFNSNQLWNLNAQKIVD